MFEAKQLWWPPLPRLYALLIGVSIKDSNEDARALEDRLKEYDSILLHGYCFFKPPSASSKKAVETESSLAIDKKKIPVAPELRGLALELSGYLRLDEVQSYVLLRRWQSDHKEEAAAAQLSAAHLESIMEFYSLERSYAAESLKLLVQLSQGNTESEVAGVGRAALERLQKAGLKRIHLQALLDNLKPLAASGEQLQAESLALLPFAQGALPISERRRQQAKQERIVLLETLLILQSDGGAVLPAEDWLRLASSIGGALYARGPAPNTEQGKLLGRAQQLATLLLIQGLDLEALLSLVAAGSPVSGSSHPFFDADSRQKAHDVLGAWWLQANEAHAPVLMAWAVLAALTSSIYEGDGSKDEYSNHAHTAYESGALKALAQLGRSGQRAADALPSGLPSTVLLPLLAGMVAAFGLTPDRLPLEDLNHVLQLFSAIYEGQPELCTEFWDQENMTAEPLRHFLHEARNLFPACSRPLVEVLAAVSSAPSAALEANAYLDQLPAAAQSYSRTDAQLQGVQEASCSSQQRATAATALPLLGVEGAIAQGSTGLICSLPPCVAGHAGGMADSEAAGHCLVRWQLPQMMAAGQSLLLLQMLRELRSLQQGAGGGSLPGATSVLLPGMRLLARMTSAEPGLALALAQLQLPADSGGEADLLSLLTAGLSLQRGPAGLADAEALQLYEDCLRVGTALAQNLPARVADSLSATDLLRPQSLMQAGPQAIAHLDSTLRFVAQTVPALRDLQKAEAAVGAFSVTEAFLQLTLSLLRNGLHTASLQAYVAFVLSHIIPRHGRWPYRSGAQRWRISAAAFSVIHAALSEMPHQPSGAARASGAVPLAADLEVALAKAIAQDPESLLAALPPSAAELEAWAQQGADVAAAEDAALAWQRLLPALQAASGSPLSAMAQALFEVPRPGQPSAASCLASLVMHPYLDAAGRRDTLRGLAALAQACSRLSSMSFAGSLLAACGSEGLQRMRGALLDSFRVEDGVAADPGQYSAAIELLLIALSHHPSLVDMMLFPTDLQGSQGKGGRKEAGKKVLALPAASQKDSSASAWSCLDGLWDALCHSSKLRAQQPAVLAQASRALLGMWQAGPMAWKATEILREQPQLWQCLAGCLPDAAQRSLALSAPAAAVHEESEDAGEGEVQEWLRKGDTAWRLAAEASALQLFALEAFASPAGSGASPARKMLEGWAEDADGGKLGTLLQRYGAGPPSRALLTTLGRQADLAAQDLACLVLADDVLGRLVQQPGSLLGSLHAALRPVAASFGSWSAASQALRDLAKHKGLQKQLQALHLGRLLLREAEADAPSTQQAVRDVDAEVLEERLASSGQAGPSYGPQYLYSAPRLERRLGPDFARSIPSVCALMQSLRAMSILASTEDARLEALRSLAAAVAVAYRGDGRSPAGLPLVSAAVDALSRALLPVLAQAARGQGDEDGIAFSWLSSSMAAAAETSQICLMLVQKWQSRSKGLGSSSVALCLKLLNLARSWLSSRGILQSSGGSVDHVETVDESLLASLLLVLQQLPSLLTSPPRSDAVPKVREGLSQALMQLAAVAQTAHSCSCTASSIICTIIQRHLPSATWTTFLQETELNLVNLLERALETLTRSRSRAKGTEKSAQLPASQSDAEGLMGSALLLILAVSQYRAAAQLLADQGLTGRLLDTASWLLDPDGAGLDGTVTEVPVAGGQGRAGSGQVARAPDYAGAYSTSGQRSRVHVHWCSLIGIFGVLVRALPGWAEAEADAVAFVVAAEDRLMLALEAPEGTQAQPLTLGALQEMQRSLFLLTGMARLLGQWQLALPGSLPAARQLAATFLEFAAQARLGERLAFHCPPIDPKEKAQARQKPGLQAGEGWFDVCAEGSRPAGPRSSQDPRHSEFSACLGEAMYSATAQALAFLCAVAPQVDEEEVAAGLGPGWPSARVLANLQQHCIALSYEACQHSCEGEGRAARLCGMLLTIVAATRRLQVAQGITVEAALKERHKLEDAEKYMSAALSEAIKGFGDDDPHVAAARQNLAEQYRVMHKYNLALPLYNQAVESLTSSYGLQDIRTATALHNLAGLHMALKDSEAAVKVMQSAVEAKRLALGPSHPAVTESVLGLAAIFRASGRNQAAIDVIEKELHFLTQEGLKASPGALMLMRRLAEDQREAGMLPEADATCRALKAAISGDASRPAHDPLLIGTCLQLAQILKARGQLAEARQLCEEANSLNAAWSHAGRYPGYWPALHLLVEVELQVGTQDSHLRALNCLQTFCSGMHALLDSSAAAGRGAEQGLWYQPSTWLGRLKQQEAEVPTNVLPIVVWLTEAYHYLARVQSKLHRHAEARSTLTQACGVLQSAVVIHALEALDASQTSARLRALLDTRQQHLEQELAAIQRLEAQAHH
ncbi:hypothetical protein CVIRNUC_007023 [Coccomyxa viridis]|uniref:Nucleoporin Nup188 N-terminal domain-containing protein n=1 Tax=Coccomyxa viridis TaxID=1274662 RepID=A0AAV1ID55_9CHLO|nr:hypothetical protein CVIRNUC_007023 [Coccomyxa viridis]